MATTTQLLNLTYGQYNNSIEVFVYSKVKTLHVLLPAFCIAYSLGVPISAGVTSTSG